MNATVAPPLISRIVVPTDGQPERQHAFFIAADLARRLDAHVELFSIAERGELAFRFDLLEAHAATMGSGVGTNVISGHDVARSLERLASEPDTLVCLPSDGRTALTELFSHGISAWVLEHATEPLIVVGPECDAAIGGTQLAIAVDGTPEGERIVGPAVRLAHALALTPFLYQVLPSRHEDHITLPRTLSDTSDTVPETAYVRNLARRVSTPEVEVQYDVIHDTAGRGLRRLTHDPDIALLAIATHGHRPVERLVEPSLTHQLIRHATCPVLVGHRASPPEPAPVFNAGPRVVVALHGLPEDAAILDVAMNEALAREATLEIVHCYGTSWTLPPHGTIATAADTALHDTAVAEMNAAVEAAHAKYPDLPVTVWLTRRLPDSAVPAAAVGADVVIIGEYHYGRLETAIFGHLADSLINEIPVPIIIVPEPMLR